MPQTLEHLDAVLKGAEQVFSQAQIEAALDQIAANVTHDLVAQNPLVITVMLGGQLPASALLTRLKFPLEMDYLHATRYGAQTTGGALSWVARPKAPLAGRNVLIVDDILDEGHTLAAIVAHCRLEGAASVKTAVLIEKLHDRRAPGIVADYVGLRVDDRYIVGYGMDYKGYFRNLPAIYAINDA
jgi:hypoxanthine phosphoribosyltransferase